MTWLEKLVRPEILELDPYSSARREYSGAVEIKLDANENPWPPYGTRAPLNRYPEPQPKLLKQRLANIYQIEESQLLITRGMDEGIDLLIRTFCNPGKDAIVIIPPTFGYYQVAASICGVKVMQAKLDELEQLEQGKLIFLCTPNNPTGESISLDKIDKICNSYRGIVAVDEAYIEFSDIPSATCLLKQYPNLVVMRTLSKAYALAGVRIGIIIANPEIIEVLKKVLPPYPIAQTCSDIALQALSPIGLYYTNNKVNEIKEQRLYLYQQLSKCSQVIRIYSSDANFLLVTFKDSDAVYQRLKSAGIITRNRSNEIQGAIRITVGSREENDLLLCALGLLEKISEPIRVASYNRKTNETEILCKTSFDGLGEKNISTEIRFFDHMLEQLAKHSGISMLIRAKGDVDIDAHHTVEDVAIVLGKSLKTALGDKYGISRYGFVLPMDESEAQVSIDLSGRGYCSFDVKFTSQQVGDMPTEMIKHFFETLSINLEAAIHIKVTGDNTHHMVESCFKCFAKALKQAVSKDGNSLPSTKGVL